MKRFVRLLEAGRLDVSAVPHAALRKRLAAAKPPRRAGEGVAAKDAQVLVSGPGRSKAASARS